MSVTISTQLGPTVRSHFNSIGGSYFHDCGLWWELLFQGMTPSWRSAEIVTFLLSISGILKVSLVVARPNSPCAQGRKNRWEFYANQISSLSFQPECAPAPKTPARMTMSLLGAPFGHVHGHPKFAYFPGDFGGHFTLLSGLSNLAFVQITNVFAIGANCVY